MPNCNNNELYTTTKVLQGACVDGMLQSGYGCSCGKPCPPQNCCPSLIAGPTGPTGPAGPAGEIGPTGPTGPSGVVTPAALVPTLADTATLPEVIDTVNQIISSLVEAGLMA